MLDDTDATDAPGAAGVADVVEDETVYCTDATVDEIEAMVAVAVVEADHGPTATVDGYEVKEEAVGGADELTADESWVADLRWAKASLWLLEDVDGWWTQSTVEVDADGAQQDGDGDDKSMSDVTDDRDAVLPNADVKVMRSILQKDSGTARRKRVNAESQGAKMRQHAKVTRRELKKEGSHIPSWLIAQPPPLPIVDSKRQTTAYKAALAKGSGKSSRSSHWSK